LRLFLALFLLLPSFAFSDNVLSAEKFLSDLSKDFEGVKDYTAVVAVTQGKTSSHGTLFYKAPSSLRINFDDPEGQVLVIDNDKLTAYFPQYGVVLEQRYRQKADSSVENLVSSQGLLMLQRNYSVGYLSGPSPVPLEQGSKEMVVKLKLVPVTTTGFSQLVVSVKGTQIRRIEGTEQSGDTISLDMANVHVNTGLPASRFTYDPPEDATVISDWLFNPEG